MASVMRGKAWVFGDSLDVDWDICPFSVLRKIFDEGRYPPEPEELGPYCMTTIDPEFPKKVSRGDFIVAGENMGYGHDHEHASMSIRGAGVGAVLCESSNAYFLRNSIDCGLPVVEVEGIKSIVSQGDELKLDLEKGYVQNLTNEGKLEFKPLPGFILEILEDGGLYPHLRRQIERGVSF